MRLYISIIVTLFFCFCKPAKQIRSNVPITIKSEIIDSLKYFKVTKLDSVDNVYLIYAQKNNSTYKILSLNNKKLIQFGDKIIVNGIYNFKLRSIFKRPRTPSVTGISYYGSNIIIDENCVYDLFEAEDIKGLYFLGK